MEGVKQVRDAWDSGASSNYRQTWLALADTTALRKMLNSIKVLSGFELAGERIFVAYEAGADNQPLVSQEDEHSCFSDNTHRDIILNAKGMDNLYKGSYTRTNGVVVSGFSLEDLVAKTDAAANDSVLAALTATSTAVNAIYVPFDQAIVLTGERPEVLAAVTALQHQEEKIKEAAAALGITLQ
jgi:putative iron-regulated protein